ncbi:MAG: inverse autotransporter beta domain-containing protein [Planctomycetaceae bacterium]
MYVSTQRLIARMKLNSKYALGLSLGLVLSLFARTGFGQDDLTLPPLPDIFRAQSDLGNSQSLLVPPPGPRSEFGDAVQDGLLFGDQLSGRTGEAYGALFRAGVSTGPAVGRVDTIVPMEIMPYGFINNAMVFGSLRGFRAASDGWGMNLGGGIRYYSERWDRIWGANVFYDYDNSSGGLFREVGFGFESLGSLLDVRANAYIPNGKTERLLSTELVQGSQRFVGHQLLYDNLLTFGDALRGADWELGIPIPGRIPQRHDLRVFGGGYHYNGTSVQGFTGWKARAQLNVVQNLTVQLEVMNDKIFDTSVVFGATWTYGGFRQPDDQKRTQFDRMTEMVRRGYNIAVARIPVVDKDKIAINPITNQPYFFEHVASYAPLPGADGTVEHPWQNLTLAQTALNATFPNPLDQRGNIIYVHANSTYTAGPDNTVTLIPSVRILGEGTYVDTNNVRQDVKHTIQISGLGNVLLPRATPTTFINRPLFANQLGDAVTLVSGSAAASSEFSGFQIGDPTIASSGPAGRGMVGDGVANVIANQNDINFAKGDGVFLNAISGQVTMNGTVINNLGDPVNEIALHITNAANGGRFNFGKESNTSRTSRINHEVPVGSLGGYSLSIDGTAAGSIIDMRNSDIFDGALQPVRRGGGVRLNNINGQALLNNMTLVNTNGDGIELTGGAGAGSRVSFVGAITVNGAATDSINIHDSSSSINFTPAVVGSTISIQNRNRVGFNVHNNPGGSIAVLQPITINTAAGALPLFPALAYENNAANLTFRPLQAAATVIAISGGGQDGINIGVQGENSGQFNVINGKTTIDQVTGVSLNIGNPLTVVSPAATLPLAVPLPITGAVNFDALSIDNRGGNVVTAQGIGIQIQHMNHPVTFNNATVVGNTSLNQSTAVLIHDNYYYNVGSGGVAGTGDPFNPPALLSSRVAGDVTFANLDIEGTVGGGPNNASGLDIEGLDPSPPGGPATGNRTRVTTSILDINRTTLNTGSGTALFVNNSGTRPPIITLATATTNPPSNGFTSSSGTIRSDTGRAVVIQNSTIGVGLTSVSSTNSPANGIFLDNNVNSGSEVKQNGTTIHPATFTVRGSGTGVIGSGGVITSSILDGVFVRNSETVSLTGMRITGNTENGIYANTPGLTVVSSQVDTNGRYGINVYAVAVPATTSNRTLQTTDPFFTLQSSIIRNNGNILGGSQEVLFTASHTGDYTVTMNGNTITHDMSPVAPTNVMDNNLPVQTAPAPRSNDGVLIRTIPIGNGARLFMTALNNTISLTNVTNSATTPLLSDMHVDWNGPVASGFIEGNTFNFGVGSGEGLIINLASVTATEQGSLFHIAGNTFSSPRGIATTGIDVTTAGAPATILIGNLDGFGGNVMNFVTPNAGNGVVIGNRTDDIAMLFSLDTNSQTQIFNNTITMQTTTQTQEAMVFTSITAPNTGVTISGNTITMTEPNFNNLPFLSRGIDFQSVIVGPPPQLQRVNLSGVLDNRILINNQARSVFPWFNAPANVFNGRIIVNGTPVP